MRLSYDHGINYNIINFGEYKYIVTSSPNASNISYYKDLFLKLGVTILIRLCDKKYDEAEFINIGINFVDLTIVDGSVPDKIMLDKWTNSIKNHKIIAVHCVAGLGRGPLFVCVCLIKFNYLNNLDAIELVRKNIPGSLNTKQLIFLQQLKFKKPFLWFNR